MWKRGRPCVRAPQSLPVWTVIRSSHSGTNTGRCQRSDVWNVSAHSPPCLLPQIPSLAQNRNIQERRQSPPNRPSVTAYSKKSSFVKLQTINLDTGTLSTSSRFKAAGAHGTRRRPFSDLYVTRSGTMLGGEQKADVVCHGSTASVSCHEQILR